MKSKEQLQQSLNEILINIESHYDGLVDAMCNGEEYIEKQYNEEIQMLEYRKGILEWVLN
jgi:hypothetical protein